MIRLRPQQRTALALLGYRLWVPRRELAALHAAPPAPATETRADTPLTAAPSPPALPAALPADGTTAVLPLPGITAEVHLTRDYLWLCGENLRCHWLLPPLWSEAGRLSVFAGENERRLLLALFRAVDCREALEIFMALFAAARRQPLPQPTAQTVLPDDAAQKPAIVCGQVLNGDLRDWLAGQGGGKFGKAPLKVYNFLHPFTVLGDVMLKDTLWRQWVDIKRSLF